MKRDMPQLDKQKETAIKDHAKNSKGLLQAMAG